jgi:hypothetical protein
VKISSKCNVENEIDEKTLFLSKIIRAKKFLGTRQKSSPFLFKEKDSNFFGHSYFETALVTKLNFEQYKCLGNI